MRCARASPAQLKVLSQGHFCLCLASLLFVGLCVPGDAGLGHGPTTQGRREQESESNTPAGLASRRGEALLLTRSYGGVGAVLGPYSEERAYSNRSSSSEYYNRS